MSLKDKLVAIDSANQAEAIRKSAPSGWEPGVEWRGEDGDITCYPTQEAPTVQDWDDLIRHFGFDPEKIEVHPDYPVEARAWDAHYSGNHPLSAVHASQVFRYYKARLRERGSAKLDDDLALLRPEILRWKPRKIVWAKEEVGVFLATIADVQIGKGDHGGTEQILEQFYDLLDQLADELERQKKRGTLGAVGYVAFLGDLIEQCKGSYASQASTTDLTVTRQVLGMKRLAILVLKLFLRYFETVVCVAVPGNHGQASRTGKDPDSVPSDNWDVQVLVHAVEQIHENPAFGPERLKLVIPKEEEVAVTLDLGGVLTTFVHGHVTRSGATVQKKLVEWWKGQAHDERLHGDSKILISGHYHHPTCMNDGAKTWMMAPACDPGSVWWENLGGGSAAPGIMTVRIGEDCGPRGWDDWKVSAPRGYERP